MNFKRNMLYNRYANVHQISMFSSVLTEVAFFNRMNKNEATVLPHLLLHCGFSLVWKFNLPEVSKFFVKLYNPQ